MGGAGSRRRGGEWERVLVGWFRQHGWHAERAGGGHDQHHGDILGIPGWVIEAKNHAALSLAAWCDQAALPGKPWAVIVKRRGHADPARAYTVLDLATFTHLLEKAGYR